MPPPPNLPILTMLLMGHASSGKSTIAGHFLCEHKTRKPSVLAHVCDSPQEQQRGRTQDVKSFGLVTKHFRITLIDGPGRVEYIKNFLCGASQADAALLVVDATNAAAGMDGQTREHVLLAYAMGVKQMVCAVNKMEEVSSQEEFTSIQHEVTGFLKKVGYKPMKIAFVPVSGLEGDNLFEKSPKFAWHNGFTLKGAIDNLTPIQRRVDKPLRLPIQNVFKIGGVGTVIIGRVESGKIKEGMKVRITPMGKEAVVQTIEMHQEEEQEASAGQCVGFHVKGVSVRDIKRGYVVSNAEDQPAVAVESFVAQVIVMNHKGKIKNGYTPVVHCHTAHVACCFRKIISKLNRKTGEVLQEEPEHVENGDACLVEMVPQKPLCVEAFSEFAALGRFVVRDMKDTVGVGVIKKVTKLTNADED